MISGLDLAPALPKIVVQKFTKSILHEFFLFSRKTVESIVVSEGPAVQGIYQQVIREYPELIGGVSSLWESKRRYECITNSL